MNGKITKKDQKTGKKTPKRKYTLSDSTPSPGSYKSLPNAVSKKPNNGPKTATVQLPPLSPGNDAFLGSEDSLETILSEEFVHREWIKAEGQLMRFKMLYKDAMDTNAAQGRQIKTQYEGIVALEKENEKLKRGLNNLLPIIRKLEKRPTNRHILKKTTDFKTAIADMKTTIGQALKIED